MKNKKKIAVLFGGRSAEHEVSLQSAKNIVSSLDRRKYQVVLIGIDKTGRWVHITDPGFFPDPGEIADSGEPVTFVPYKNRYQLLRLGDSKAIDQVDVVFPVLHGTCGEDGTIQGLLELADIPYVGAGVLGSSVGMDKDVMKRLLAQAEIPIPRFLVYSISLKTHHFDEIQQKLGMPVFVKPANLGSSVGITKVRNKQELENAVQEAFRYDDKIVVEEYIQGREIECSVLGNQHPAASAPGEIVPSHEFYSYDAKYVDEQGAVLKVPAPLEEDICQRIQQLAVETFRVLCCEGMARVDFFLKENNQVLVNELNTIPGFTRISMYPKLWEYSGIGPTELTHRLIELALERHERKKGLKKSYTE
ncbi:MAG: D-alanine--D-alanine ligase [Spirochaetota bacterium]